MKKRTTLVTFVILTTALSNISSSFAQDPTPTQSSTPSTSSTAAHWYDKYSIKGYTQLRYNRLLETNPKLKCEQCDKSWGDGNGFFLRRARLIFSGDAAERLYIYIQPDFASDGAPNSQQYFQIRDAYFDVALDSSKEFRFRLGQSKVPYGWENLQSSSNRLALDRTDGINSAAPNERDLGVFFYWAPAEIRKRFKMLVDKGLKGTGDYGVVGAGVYNGQSANRPEGNNNLHKVVRVTYPWELPSGQFFETSIQGYTGLFTVQNKTTGISGKDTSTDQRAAASFIWYPQPLGFQAEWNVGKGPKYMGATHSIGSANLQGGYLQAMYKIDVRNQSLTPFTRWQYFAGGKKQELDARAYRVRDVEVGVEWQPFPALEFTADYTISDRRMADATQQSNNQKGSLLRLQAQFNY